MKILLAACNAKYIHSNLAVYNLRAYAGEYREHIILKEYTINQQKDEILRDIYLEKPDIICFSCYIWNVSFVKEGRNVLKSVATEHRATDTQSQAPSNRWIENGSYFRLSSVSLGYTFGKIGNWINSLKLYATCNNVFTITGYSGRDPEINLGGLEPGMDRRTNYYPRTRSFMIGVNMNF